MTKNERALSLMGGRGGLVNPADLPFELGALPPDDAPEAPPRFVYCEYWTLKALAQAWGVTLLFLAVGAALTIGGLVMDQANMIWAAGALWILFLAAVVWEGARMLAGIINWRAGGPARRDVVSYRDYP